MLRCGERAMNLKKVLRNSKEEETNHLYDVAINYGGDLDEKFA